MVPLALIMKRSLMLISAEGGNHLLVDMSSLWQVAWQQCAPKHQHISISHKVIFSSTFLDFQNTSINTLSPMLRLVVRVIWLFYPRKIV
jgi:hypothetical protein